MYVSIYLSWINFWMLTSFALNTYHFVELCARWPVELQVLQKARWENIWYVYSVKLKPILLISWLTLRTLSWVMLVIYQGCQNQSVWSGHGLKSHNQKLWGYITLWSKFTACKVVVNWSWAVFYSFSFWCELRITNAKFLESDPTAPWLTSSAASTSFLAFPKESLVSHCQILLCRMLIDL